MDDATWRRTNKPFGDGTHRIGSRKTGSVSRTAAMRAMGSVVYAARLDDGTIKIGCTERFDLRLHWLKHQNQQDVELLGFRSGVYADEQAIHAGLVEHRHHGREYYHPTPEVMAVVNDMRTDLGLPLLAA